MLSEGCFRWERAGPPAQGGLGTRRPCPEARFPRRRPGRTGGERTAAGPSAARGRAAAPAASVCRPFNFPFLVLLPPERPAAECQTSSVVCGLSPQSQYYLRWAQ